MDWNWTYSYWVERKWIIVDWDIWRIEFYIISIHQWLSQLESIADSKDTIIRNGCGNRLKKMKMKRDCQKKSNCYNCNYFIKKDMTCKGGYSTAVIISEEVALMTDCEWFEEKKIKS